jgi:hypothetical protein
MAPIAPRACALDSRTMRSATHNGLWYDTLNPEFLLKNADEALYDAKHRPGGVIQLFDNSYMTYHFYPVFPVDKLLYLHTRDQRSDETHGIDVLSLLDLDQKLGPRPLSQVAAFFVWSKQTSCPDCAQRAPTHRHVW